MNLSDFEDYFSPRILERGKDYYQNHRVISVQKIKDGDYKAEVTGSEIYTVFAELDEKGEVIDISCDCPYEQEEFCKHEAAVLYTLRKQKAGILPVREPKQQDSLPKLLATYEKEQLITWMMEYAKENRGFLDYLQVRASKKLNAEELLANLHRSCNRFFSGRILWKELQKRIEFLLKSMQDWADAEKVQTILNMIQLMETQLEERCCDSDWVMYEGIAVCTDTIKKSVQGIVARQDWKSAEKVYQSMIHAFQEDILSGENVAFSILLELCALPEYRKKTEEFLKYRQAVAEGNYEKEELEEQQFQILKRYGTPQEQRDFINQHLSNSKYRRMAIQNAIDTGDESTVERLALDGEYQEWNGLQIEWKKYRHDSYQRTGERKKLADVCEELLKNGEPDYYDEWKALIPPEQQPQKIEQLLKDVQGAVYRRILVKEKRVDLMMEACREDPAELLLYDQFLKDSPFADEATKLYTDWILDESDCAGNRSEYAAVCQKLKKFSKYHPEPANALAREIRAVFSRKPAFQDELRKAGF